MVARLPAGRWSPATYALGGALAIGLPVAGGYAYLRRDAPHEPAFDRNADADRWKSCPDPSEDDVRRFEAWLRERQGVASRGIRIGSARADGSGLGVFTQGRVGAWGGSVATYPLRGAITHRTLLQDGRVGALFSNLREGKLDRNGDGPAATLASLAEEDPLDDRDLTMLFLMLERHRGIRSAWAPYLAVLPAAPRSAATFPSRLRPWLRGTNLGAAVDALHANLRASFAHRILPAAEAMLALDDASTPSPPPAALWDAYLWAHAVYWSRAIGVPSSSSSSSGEGSAEEALVPGLDFCNHRGGAEAGARWRAAGRGGSRTIALRLRRGHAAGEEVCIDYGGRSNEALLFLYGFADPSHVGEDALKLDCLAFVSLANPAEWSEGRRAAFEARLEAAEGAGLKTSVFLNARDVGDATGVAQSLPPKFMATLAFLWNDGEGKGEGKREGKGKGRGGDSYAALTCMYKLMQAVVRRLEHPEEGTGPLENDLALLARNRKEKGAAFGQGMGGGKGEGEDEGEGEGEGEGLGAGERACVVYRMGQKRIARAFLARASAELAKHSGRNR